MREFTEDFLLMEEGLQHIVLEALNNVGHGEWVGNDEESQFSVKLMECDSDEASTLKALLMIVDQAYDVQRVYEIHNRAVN